MRVDIELPVLLVEAARRLGTDLVAELQPLLCGEPGHRAGSVVVPLELTDKSNDRPGHLVKKIFGLT